MTDTNADDLNDQWAHNYHEGERKRLLEVMTTPNSRKQLTCGMSRTAIP